MDILERYEEYKEKYQYSVVLVRDGSFYRTYDSDAIILWNLLHYKWNRDSISFGVSCANKVFDELRNQNIGFFVLDTQEK